MKIDKKTGSAHLILNTDFVSQYCEKPVRFATLICHEVMHHIFGHYVHEHEDPELNVHNDLIQDVVINSYIYRTSQGFAQLFNDLYEKTTFPSMILRPSGVARRIENLALQKYAQTIINGFWPRYAITKPQYTIDDLRVLLADMHKAAVDIKKDNIANNRAPLEGLIGIEPGWLDDNSAYTLGDHEPKEDDTFSEHDNQEYEIGKILDGLTNELSQGDGGNFFTETFQVERAIPPDQMARALEEALRKDILLRQEIVECLVGRELTEESPVPYYIGHKEALMLSRKWWPRTYPTHGPSEDIDGGGDVRIYLDVSGSMGNSSKFLLMLLTGFKNRVANELYEFSSKIAPINFGDLVEKFETTGELFIQTTGGTDFDPIFAHAREQGFEKILLITDGYASVREEVNREFAKSIETYTLFTVQHQPHPLDELSKNTWVMPELNIPKDY